MLNSRTTIANNHKRQTITNKYYSNNSICLPSITSSRRLHPKYLISSLSLLIHKTDAILVDGHQNNFISAKQARYIKLKQQQHKKSKEELDFGKNISSKQQLVNPYSNNIFDNHRSSKLIMSNIYYFMTLSLALCALLQSTEFVNADSSLQTQLNKFKISDVVNTTSYIKNIKVELHGNNVKPGDVVLAKNFKGSDMNKITWDVDDNEARHTLLLLDLDRARSATNNNNNTSNIYNQYTNVNIPGSSIASGQAVVGFDIPVVPCQPSIKHRILVLALLQQQNIDIVDVGYMSTPSGHSVKRENFKLAEFIRRHRLEPVAANVFYAIGELNGVCSGSQTLHSLGNHLSLILIAMVIAITAYDFSNRKLFIN